eukprot:CAMPEP_0174714036 /NCGR_PEP_ID=MMETSP1094-20130205/16133_1 /TAXON_ID=156173 /ORGANISM="Chrysochromulina brevifilum, Strain UTEX LB 985" /LENGTH=102 /DNA_ID=CAMNT_0015913293 /DNA_START=52 /DNA_END=357 /DNA_ORIENTATION=-
MTSHMLQLPLCPVRPSTKDATSLLRSRTERVREPVSEAISHAMISDSYPVQCCPASVVPGGQLLDVQPAAAACDGGTMNFDSAGVTAWFAAATCPFRAGDMW